MRKWKSEVKEGRRGAWESRSWEPLDLFIKKDATRLNQRRGERKRGRDEGNILN
jgi:hypothetical protein